MIPLYPALSHHFGLHPPVVAEMTPRELQPYLDELTRFARDKQRST